MAKRRWKWWDTTRRDPTAYITVQNMVPNSAGNYQSAPPLSGWGSGNTSSSAGSATTNADAFQQSDGTARLFVCAQQKILEVTSSSITDRSKGGGTYTAGSIWHGAQYGNVTIYTNFADVVQASSSGAFADLAGTPPKARFVCTQSLAVILAAYNDGVNTYEDGVWISDIGDQTTWTPASSNQAANFRLLQTPGKITGVCPFRGSVLVFKESSFYRVSYVGRPIIWQVELISSVAGAPSMGLICACDDVVIFGGQAGWFAYDGASLTQIAPNASPRSNLSLIAGYGSNAQSPFGPDISKYTYGSSYYDASRGMAHFAPQNSSTVPVIVVQAHRGEGFGAIGQYLCYVGGTVQTLLCLARGTQAALFASGLGAGAPSGSMPCPGVFFLRSSVASPFAMDEYVGSANSSNNGTWVQTSFFGDPRTKTTFRRVTPLTAYFAGDAPFSDLTMNIYTSEYAALNSADLTTATATGARNSGDTETYDFTITTRFACFSLYTTNRVEIEDIYVDSVGAGAH